jgi:hypothetical protein
VEMVRNMKYTLILIALSASAFAADFMLAIGSPVAASLPGAPTTSDGTPVQVRKGDAAFAIRTENCADPANALITATAEGLVNGERQSMALRLLPGSGPGVYLVPRGWPAQGVWIVRLIGSCHDAKAGALVPIGPGGFIRESSKFFPRFATEADIETSLKSLAGGAK